MAICNLADQFGAEVPIKQCAKIAPEKSLPDIGRDTARWLSEPV